MIRMENFYQMKISIIPWLLFPLLVAGGCSVLKTERPPENYQTTAWLPRYSYINVPVATDAKSLKRIINKEIVGVIYSDTSFEDHNKDDLMITALKSDSIGIGIDNNVVSYRVPLKVWIKKRLTVGLLGYSYTNIMDAYAEVVLKFKTTVSLNTDWSFNTITFSDGYEWISYPQLMVGPMQIPLPVISDLLVKSNLQTLTKEIDRSIKQSFNLRSVMNDAWTGMQKPFLVSPDYSLWLKLTPVELSSIPIRGTAAGFSHSIGIKALVQLFFGREPEYSVNPALPPLKITSAIPENFNINFSLDIPFTRINELARQQFRGTSFNYHAYKITVEDITLYGQGENMIVALVVDGSIKGTIYFSGIPAFNKVDMTISLANLDFSLNTKNVLVKTASWMFHAGLLQKISSSLVFQVGDKLRDAKKELNAYLLQNQSLSYFRITGEIEKLDPDKILISPEAVKAYFQFEGKVRLVVAQN